MEQLFAAFITLGVILELFEHNRARYVAVSGKKLELYITSVISSSIIYLLFIIAGWYATELLPDLSAVTGFILSLVVLTLLIVYNFLRDRRYVSAGKMIYANFKLFMLVSVGRGILQVLTGFLMALLSVDLLWFVSSFALGVVLFGLAVILAKGDKISIFGIAIGYIKISAFILAGILIFINFIYGNS
ncbi:MAG: hypothetical protein C0599_13170 [Salinivirgaceae bacterium]|nr:MAG: hypothetical protein C0599_13170 [Salinivirgaceae bacterium]